MAEQLANIFPEISRRYARCLKKLGYQTYADADQVRARRQALTDKILRIYECTDCGFLHLTHKALSPAQVLAEEAILTGEIAKFNRASTRLMTLVTPYNRGHCMRRKMPWQIERDFAQQWALRMQCEDLLQAGFQREVALDRAQAANLREVQRIDQEALKMIAEREAILREDGPTGGTL